MSSNKLYLLYYVRSTKNKHVYADKADIMGAIYISKSELPDDPPKQITMTIEL